ncbi:MAG: glycosyltransferase family 4 protein [Nocardioides sp.]|nr:glycosyltransferase family 4 protein [Nocardioides sp.]
MPDPKRLARGVVRRARRLRVRMAATYRSGEPRSIPDPRDQPTHIGPIFDAGVAAARQRMQAAGIDLEYDVAYESFDLAHFLLQARNLLTEDRDPLEQFLGNGAQAKASPEINFDMRTYLARHPERSAGLARSPYVAWLREGKQAGEIADPAPGLELMAPVLGLSEAKIADLLGSLRLDVQHRLRTGRLGEMVAKAADVEPLIAESWSQTAAPKIPPFYNDTTSVQVAAIHGAQRAAGFTRARVVLVVSDPRWGGGRRAEGHLAHALARHLDPSEVVVVYTEREGRAPHGRFPEGVREVDLVLNLQELAPEDAGRALVELIRSFNPDLVINVNSVLLYLAMNSYGKALAATQRIFLVMFGNERLALGNWVGLPLRYFYRCVDLVEGVITDSDHLREWLVDRYQLPQETQDRIHVFRAPVDPGLEPAAANARNPSARPQVYWAGRFDRQKRVDLAFEIARRMPDVDFRMWGEEVLNAPLLEEPPANAHLHGPYQHISELDLAGADAWLYTSAWDGVPSQLLEVAMTGIPLVASEVGGTGEVLSREDAWPVTEFEDPDAYVTALREVLSDPSGARRRAAALRERMLRERTEEAYDMQVATILLGLDEKVGVAPGREAAS